MLDHRLFSSLIFLSLLLPVRAFALEHWHLPMVKEIKTIMVYNANSQAKTLWISKPVKDIETAFEETYQVPAFGRLEIPLLQYKDTSFIHIKAEEENTLQIQALTSSGRSFFVNPGWQTKWKVRGRSGGELALSNLSPFAQKVQVKTSNGQVSAVDLLAFETKKVPMTSTSFYSVEGEARIAGAQVSSNISQGFTYDSAVATLSPSPGRYFLLMNSQKNQSFVVKIEDAVLLAQALEQIAKPDQFLGRILIGQIDFGNQGHNRDLLSVAQAPWSWHVAKILRFAQFAIQDCDGSPELLEDVLNPWRNSGMPICFWNYRIVRELSLSEVSQGSRHKKP